MDPLLLFASPLLVVIASASVVWCLMRRKHEAALVGEQAALSTACARIEALESDLEQRLRTATEVGRRQAFETFLSQFRVEERRLVQEDGSTAKPLLVLRQRLFLRRVPLSNGIGNEIRLRHGLEPDKFDRVSAFCVDALGTYVKPANAAAGAKLLMN